MKRLKTYSSLWPLLYPILRYRGRRNSYCFFNPRKKYRLTLSNDHERCTSFSQGSVARLVRCGGIFNGGFIANFQEIVTVKESGSIWWSYFGMFRGGRFFSRHGVFYVISKPVYCLHNTDIRLLGMPGYVTMTTAESSRWSWVCVIDVIVVVRLSSHACRSRLIANVVAICRNHFAIMFRLDARDQLNQPSTGAADRHRRRTASQRPRPTHYPALASQLARPRPLGRCPLKRKIDE